MYQSEVDESGIDLSAVVGEEGEDENLLADEPLMTEEPVMAEELTEY